MAEGQGSGSGWLKGCAIGCGVILLLAVAAAVGVYVWINKMAEQGKVEMQGEVKKVYESVMPELQVDSEDFPFIDELYAHSQREGLNPSASMLSSVMVLSILEDGKVVEEEQAVAEEIAGLLREEPNPGMVQVLTWLGSHPELQQRLQNMGNSRRVPVQAPALVEVEAVSEEAKPEEAAPVQ